MAKRSLILERGLRPDQTKDGEIAVMIAERNWFNFTDQSELAIIVVVKEFYANVKEHYYFGMQVWGKTVKLASKDINKIYNLHNEGSRSQYTNFLSQGPDYEQIIRELCQPGTTWTTHERGSKIPTHALADMGRLGTPSYVQN